MTDLFEIIEPKRVTLNPYAALVDMRMRWLREARPKQLPPPDDYLTWLNRCGRGYGKTRLGAEETCWNAGTMPGTRWAVVAPTYNDVRFTCFEGESGILSILPAICIPQGGWNKSYLELRLWNGSEIRGFAASEPGRLRGPQFHGGWFDELAATAREAIEEAWSNLQFACRLRYRDRNPTICVTTTPKPIPLIKKIRQAKGTITTTGSTYDNRENLAPSFFDRIVQYEGTKIGRQEIHGEEIDPEEAGIVKRSWFKLWPMRNGLPSFQYVIMSIDSAFKEKQYDKQNDPDYSACTTYGVFNIRTGVERLPGGVEKPKYRANVMLLDAWRDHLGLPDLVTKVRAQAHNTFGPVVRPVVKSAMYGVVPSEISGTGKKVDLIVIEDKASGISLIQTLAKHKLFVHPYNPGNDDKMMRLHLVSHIPHAGLVWIPESRATAADESLKDSERKFSGWANEFLDEVCAQPNGEYWDYTDTFTQALRVLSDKDVLSVTVPKAYEKPPGFDPDAPLPERPKNPYGR